MSLRLSKHVHRNAMDLLLLHPLALLCIYNSTCKHEQAVCLSSLSKRYLSTFSCSSILWQSPCGCVAESTEKDLECPLVLAITLTVRCCPHVLAPLGTGLGRWRRQHRSLLLSRTNSYLRVAEAMLGSARLPLMRATSLGCMQVPQWASGPFVSKWFVWSLTLLPTRKTNEHTRIKTHYRHQPHLTSA